MDGSREFHIVKDIDKTTHNYLFAKPEMNCQGLFNQVYKIFTYHPLSSGQVGLNFNKTLVIYVAFYVIIKTTIVSP